MSGCHQASGDEQNMADGVEREPKTHLVFMCMAVRLRGAACRNRETSHPHGPGKAGDPEAEMTAGSKVTAQGAARSISHRTLHQRAVTSFQWARILPEGKTLEKAFLHFFFSFVVQYTSAHKTLCKIDLGSNLNLIYKEG